MIPEYELCDPILRNTHKGRTACANLAFYYQQGIHVRKDEQKALYYYQKSCSQKLSYACRQAELIEKQLNYKMLNNQ